MLKTIKLWWNKHILGRVEAKPAPTLSDMSGWSTPNQAALAASFGTPYKKPDVHHDDNIASDMLAILAINAIVQRNDGVVVQATPEEPVYIGTAPAPEPVYATPAYEAPAPAPTTDWGSTSYSSTDYGSTSYDSGSSYSSSDSSSDSSSSSSWDWD